MSAVRVEQHPEFVAQYVEMSASARDSEQQLDLLGDVTALVGALEDFGHAIEEDNHHADSISHPIVTSRYQTFALRRTPPTSVTPYAYAAPVLRIPYVWFVDKGTNEEVAVVMLIGDKTASGNDWYPVVVNRIDNAGMVADWERLRPGHKARMRRAR